MSHEIWDVDGEVGAVEMDVRLLKLSQEPDRERALRALVLELDGEVDVVDSEAVLDLVAVQAAQRRVCWRPER